MLGAADGLQHVRENLLTIEQFLDPISARQRWPQRRAGNAAKLRVVRGVKPGQFAADVFFAAGEIGQAGDGTERWHAL